MHMSESMKELLDHYSIADLEKASHIPYRARRYRIWKKYDAKAKPYWGVLNFCGMSTDGIPAERHLGWLEWDGNEVHISALVDTKVPSLLKRAAGIMKYWKRQLEKEYPTIPFVIFASYGNNLEFLEEGDEEDYYVTMRFFVVRDGDMLLNFDSMENNAQPVMWYCCNFK